MNVRLIEWVYDDEVVVPRHDRVVVVVLQSASEPETVDHEPAHVIRASFQRIHVRERPLGVGMLVTPGVMVRDAIEVVVVKVVRVKVGGRVVVMSLSSLSPSPPLDPPRVQIRPIGQHPRLPFDSSTQLEVTGQHPGKAQQR